MPALLAKYDEVLTEVKACLADIDRVVQRDAPIEDIREDVSFTRKRILHFLETFRGELL